MAALFAIVLAICLSLLSKTCTCETTERGVIEITVKSVNDVRIVTVNQNDEGSPDLQAWIQCGKLKCNMGTQWCNTASGDGICSPCETWCKDGGNAGICKQNCPVYLGLEERRRSAAITSVIEESVPGKNLTTEESTDDLEYQESHCSGKDTWVQVLPLTLSITANLVLGAVLLVISLRGKSLLSKKCAELLPWPVQQDEPIIVQPQQESTKQGSTRVNKSTQVETDDEAAQAAVSHIDETLGNTTCETSVKAVFSGGPAQPSDEESTALLQQPSQRLTRPQSQMSETSRSTSSGIRNNFGVSSRNQPVRRTVSTETDGSSVAMRAQVHQSPQEDTEAFNPAYSDMWTGDSSMQTIESGSGIPGSSASPLLQSQCT